MRPLKKLGHSLHGLNSIIYGMMLACIAQCHSTITNNNGASVHCHDYR